MVEFRLIDNTHSPEDDELLSYYNPSYYSCQLNFKDDDEMSDWYINNFDIIMKPFFDIMETGGNPWQGVHDLDGQEGIWGYASYEIEDYETAFKKWLEFWKLHGKLI